MVERSIFLNERRVYTNPVFRGDHPDPSVVRVGNRYWATATSTEWAPQFPLLVSDDLVHWKQTGAVFEKSPSWTRGQYWAPEISQHNGTFYVYYVARHADGPLTIGVATASQPQGPYTDCGPLVGQTSGSIDPTTVRGDDGTRYLIWKEDGNSVGLPTTLWIQPLSDDGLRLIGEARSILSNDAEWEGHVIEAPSVIRRDGYYYMFYSGNACCGRQCKYAVGVARARSPLGPWEKCAANPILKGNGQWRCPGHGSVVDDEHGRTFFLYHAYAKRDSIFIGRQMLLDRVTWHDGWPQIADGTPSVQAPLPFARRRFPSFRLKHSTHAGPWQWPHDRAPRVSVSRIRSRRITVAATDDSTDTLAAVLARAPHFADYVAETAVHISRLASGTEAGICAYGDAKNAVGLSYVNGMLRVWQRAAGKHRILSETPAPKTASLRLRMHASRGYLFSFEVFDAGRWQALRSAPLRAAHLPPWDRGVRAAVTVGGIKNAQAAFSTLQIRKRHADVREIVSEKLPTMPSRRRLAI